MLFILYAGILLCQSNNPTQQSNPDINFYHFMSGVRCASVEFNEEAQRGVDNGEQNELITEIFYYLKELGFEYVLMTSKQKESIVNLPSLCDIVRVIFSLDHNNKFLRNININFVSCLGDVFTFSSNKIIDNDRNWLTNVSEEWRNMYSSKPSYKEYARLLLPVEESEWDYQKLKDHFDKYGCHEIEGIYEKIRLSQNEIVDAKYVIGIVQSEKDKYDIIYLGGANNYIDWQEGELKGKIIRTATPNFYSVNWLMADKTLNEDVYCSFDENQLLSFVFIPSSKEQNAESKFLKLYPSANSTHNRGGIYKSGTAFAISIDGYVLTNYHVIEGSNDFNLISYSDGKIIEYTLNKIAEDRKNDIALLRIEDEKFEKFPKIPFSIKQNTAEVGEEVFTLGYPLTNSMGTELKATDGIISSKSGFEGDISSYQISVPVQPGNSGGPLFDKSGNLLGIVSAKHENTDNVSYALKSNYIKSFLESLPINLSVNNKNLLEGKSLADIINKLRQFIFIINCK